MHVYILLPGKAVLPLFFIFFASFFRIDNLRLLFLSFADNIERISNHLLKEKKKTSLCCIIIEAFIVLSICTLSNVCRKQFIRS